MLQKYPKDIIHMVPPKTETESKQTILYGLPFLLVLLLFPFFATWMDSRFHSYSFWQIVGISYSISTIGNIYDLLIIEG